MLGLHNRNEIMKGERFNGPGGCVLTCDTFRKPAKKNKMIHR